MQYNTIADIFFCIVKTYFQASHFLTLARAETGDDSLILFGPLSGAKLYPWWSVKWRWTEERRGGDWNGAPHKTHRTCFFALCSSALSSSTSSNSIESGVDTTYFCISNFIITGRCLLVGWWNGILEKHALLVFKFAKHGWWNGDLQVSGLRIMSSLSCVHVERRQANKHST